MRASVLSIGLALSFQSVPIGNGSISGVVIESRNSSPIPDVQVEISAIRLSPPSPQSKKIYTTTDDAGRFEIRDLPAGRYKIHWQRAGFFAPKDYRDSGISFWTRSGFFQLNVRQSGRLFIGPEMEVLVDPKQPANKVTLSLMAGGVISGRVLNPGGEPMAGETVTALRISYVQGYPILYQESSVTADERGNFRLWGLHPGRYYIRAQYRTDQQAAFPFTYFAGVSNLSAAQTITVASGAELKGADFNVQQGTSKILGSLVITPPSLAGPRRLSGNGTPLPYTVGYFLVPVDTSSAVDVQAVWASNQSYTGDRFEIRGVRPGNYVLYSVLSPEKEPGDSEDRREFIVGRTVVNVGAQDLENVVVVIAAPNDVHGRILAVDGARLPNDGLSLHWRLRAAVFPESRSLESWTKVGPDGTFDFSGLPGMRYDLTASDLPPNTAVVDIRQGGSSVFDQGFLADRDSAPLEVVVSGAVGRIEAKAIDAKQFDRSDAIVTLVPAMEHRPNPNLYRRAKFDPALSRYVIDGIPPGQYVLFAWDGILDDAEYNTSFLKEFEDRGTHITVRPKDSVTVQLPLISTED